MPSNALPTLLLIHGFPLDHTLWDAQVEGLNDVAKVLAPDLRGFGDDDRELPTAMTMDAYALDLKELLDSEGVDRVVLCGLSMGGYIALAFLARWPERVQSLVLANTRANADDEPGKQGREETARNALEKGMAVIARGMLPKLLTEQMRLDHPEVAALIERMIARQAPKATAAAARGMALRSDRIAELANITVPTLIITGDVDALMPLETSRSMAEAIPRSKLVILPHAGHLSNIDAPESFNTALRAHLVHVDGVVKGE